MSVVNVRSTRNVAGALNYVMKGKHSGYVRRDGDRAAAIRFSGSSLKSMIQQQKAIVARSQRSVEAYTIIQSFSLDEFNPDDPEDAQAVNRLGWALARRAFPNSPLIVVTHNDADGADGRGGKLHNHIIVMNHDVETGKSIQQNKSHPAVAKANDEIMRENGLEVIDRQPKSLEEEKQKRWKKYLDLRDGDKKGLSVRPYVEHFFIEQLQEALSVDGIRSREELFEYLKSKDIETVVKEEVNKKSGTVTTGVTYKARFEIDGKSRVRRAAASKLHPMLTAKGLDEFYEDRRLEQTLDEDASAENESLEKTPPEYSWL